MPPVLMNVQINAIHAIVACDDMRRFDEIQPRLLLNAAWQRFQQFRQTFKGDPNQQIQQMMNSGRITQDQYNRAVQMANQFRGMFR